MKIKVKRKAKATWNKAWVKELQQIGEFCAQEYNIDRRNATVEVLLKHDPSLDYAGVALTMHEFRRFIIILNSAFTVNAEHIRRLMFHEMRHIEQEYHQGLYMNEDCTEVHYDGMVYVFESQEHFDELHYDMPWEVDARNIEDKMSKKWKNYLQVAA